MKRSSSLLISGMLLVFLSLNSVMGKDFSESIRIDRSNTPVILKSFETDDPQPDTISYNDGIGGWILNGPTNIWGNVRFTPISVFELRGVYVRVNNNNNSTGGWAAYCVQDSAGYPTQNVLAGPVDLNDTPVTSEWVYAEFSNYPIFNISEDFHICYGPCPAGSYLTGDGFWPEMDGAPTENRNFYASGFSFGQLPDQWTQCNYGDYMVMSGGEYAVSTEPVIELSNSSLAFQITSPGDTSWFNLTVYNFSIGDDLVLESVELLSPDEIFGINNFVPNTVIPAGENVVLEVYFAPTDTGTFENVVQIYNNSAVSQVDIPLYGEGSYQDLSLALIPENLPIVIPAAGGSFIFDLVIENTFAVDYLIDVWTDITLPSSVEYPIIIRENINLPALGMILRENLIQNVPGTAAGGIYSYNGYVRDHNTWDLLAMDSFEFEKTGTDAYAGGHGGWTLSGWDEPAIAESKIPSNYQQFSANPNPFNPSATLLFDLPETGRATLTIYDIRGREIARLADGYFRPGRHEVDFDGSNLASGIYFARLQTEGFTKTQKLLLIK